jgi:hypothetical protein
MMHLMMFMTSWHRHSFSKSITPLGRVPGAGMDRMLEGKNKEALLF